MLPLFQSPVVPFSCLFRPSIGICAVWSCFVRYNSSPVCLTEISALRVEVGFFILLFHRESSVTYLPHRTFLASLFPKFVNSVYTMFGRRYCPRQVCVADACNYCREVCLFLLSVFLSRVVCRYALIVFLVNVSFGVVLLCCIISSRVWLPVWYPVCENKLASKPAWN